MSPIPQNLFGIHTQALDLWQSRAGVLANNLANADTPGYLARDIDFRKALSAAGGSGDGDLPLQAPTPGQIGNGQIGSGPNGEAGSAALEYRLPTQPSMDGNTVDTQVEQADFAANSVHYQASLSFITAQIHMLRTAITGGQS
ncbi:flagellar basal body rod protein FlgB [Rhodanobacter sp. Si-c]|uniref:Flagellar basal body rod protein FlgB n=1 Tax=Rhodanobacter lycopersici TaxID=3162487 RepID=A0ABV3QHS7_9GAMM